MSGKTIWRVAPIDASFHPGILTRCPLCGAFGTQGAPPEQFYHAKKHQRGTVALGLQWARDFRLVHKPLCPTVSAQYAAYEAAGRELDAAKNKIEALEQAVSQLDRELARAYISKLPSAQIAQIERKLETARTALLQGGLRHTPEIERAKSKLADAQAVLDNARNEAVPESTLIEFQTAMARYLPAADVQPVPPGAKPRNMILEV